MARPSTTYYAHDGVQDRILKTDESGDWDRFSIGTPDLFVELTPRQAEEMVELKDEFDRRVHAINIEGQRQHWAGAVLKASKNGWEICKNDVHIAEWLGLEVEWRDGVPYPVQQRRRERV